MVDFFEDSKIEAGSGREDITRLCNKALKAEREVQEFEALLQESKARYRAVIDRELPEAMTEAGLEEFVTTDGYKVVVKDFTGGHISEKNKEPAFNWLRSNNHDDLIRHEIKVQMTPQQGNIAGAILDYLYREFEIMATDTQRVHPQTLSAFVREMIKAGTPVPEDIFGVFIGKVAKITKKD